MKDRLGAILQPTQERYLERLQPPRDELLREMEAHAHEHDVPISDPEVGRLLGLFAISTRAQRILEVGTAIGYGALIMARAAPQATVVTIENDPEMARRAREFLERGGVADRVEIRMGDALAVLAQLQQEGRPFQLAYVDATKTEYRRYLDLVVPQLTIGGLVAFDNVLWKGWVADPDSADADDDNAESLRAFNPYHMIHPQLVSQVLPIGDGLALATKTAPTVMERGGPF
jgi:predicted O-methyltransferase YrrM